MQQETKKNRFKFIFAMKHTFKYILSTFVLLVPALALAQDPPIYSGYNITNGIATAKSVSGPVGKRYTITLETFAKGENTMMTEGVPADIVLVLDISQSMTADYKTDYTARNSQAYTYTNLNATYYYKHTDGNYYQVIRFRRRQGNTTQWTCAYFTVNGTTYYLVGNGVLGETSSSAPQNNDYNMVPSGARVTGGDGATIFTNVLYALQTLSRLEGLQAAVQAFVEEVWRNDNYDDQGNLRNAPLGNRIAVITYNGSSTIYNSSAPLIDVSNANRSKNDSMISGVLALTDNSINRNYGTYSDQGMTDANTVLGSIDA